MEPTDDHDEGGDGAEPSPSRSARKWVTTAAVATGLAVGAAGLAGAATGGSGSSSTAAPSGYGQVPSGEAPNGQPPGGTAGQAPNGQAPSGDAANGQAGQCDPSNMPGGQRETELTGDTATKVRDAALAEVPGATVLRLEEDSSGEAKYEAHLRKSDGTMVTVLLDADFKVISTEEGFGRGPGGRGGPPPGAPGEAPDASTGSTESSSLTTT